jgi:N6-L-threonylcarbamoyladenine synthase
LRDRVAENPDFVNENKNDLCASFQSTLIEILMDKLIKAVKETGISEITIAGGVSANSGLRDRITLEGYKRGWKTYIPEFRFTTDNAAMIAIAGYYKFASGHVTPPDIVPVSRSLDYH